jgi:hypothetical protein
MKLGFALSAVQLDIAFEDDEGFRFAGVNMRRNALVRVSRDFTQAPPSTCFRSRNQLPPFRSWAFIERTVRGSDNAHPMESRIAHRVARRLMYKPG